MDSDVPSSSGTPRPTGAIPGDPADIRPSNGSGDLDELGELIEILCDYVESDTGLYSHLNVPEQRITELARILGLEEIGAGAFHLLRLGYLVGVNDALRRFPRVVAGLGPHRPETRFRITPHGWERNTGQGWEPASSAPPTEQPAGAA
jgi:hypothetical protein